MQPGVDRGRVEELGLGGHEVDAHCLADGV
jgi:hypothetical protein